MKKKKKTPLPGHTFRSREVDDVTVFLEHIDFLNLSYWLHIEFLE